MPSRTYFLDASALVHKYSRLKTAESRRVQRRLADLFALRARFPDRASLQIPNICMAECAKTFAKFALQEKVYGDGEKAVDAFRSLRDALLRDVSKERIINSYELARRHFEDIEEMFILDHQMPAPRGMGERLSSHDALIISMATDYATKHHESLDQVVIVTCDRRIAEFCSGHRGEYASAVFALDRDIV